MSKNNFENKKWRLDIWAFGFSILSILIASYFSYQQNELEYEVSQKDYDIGKSQIISLVSLFAVNSLNQWDFTKHKNLTRDNMRTDSVSIKQYLTESEYILNSLRDLENNPFFIELFKSYNDLNMLLFQFQRDVIEIEMGNYTFGIITFKNFYKLFIFLKNNYKDNLFDSNYFKEIEKIYNTIDSGTSIN